MSYQEHARMTTANGDSMLLEGVKASGDLRGVLLEMTVEQRFRNPGTSNVEVVYGFPLPWGAVLLSVDVQLGERRLCGTVVEKTEAEAAYEGALAEGHAAIMLEKNHDRSYTLNLGNLAAQETCVVTLRYAQTLAFEQQGLRLLIPTVIAPRYGDPIADGGLRPHQAPEHSAVAAHPFDIELRLHGELAQARVASPSHPVGVAMRPESGLLQVSLARRGARDRDFVLVVDQLAHASVAVAAPDDVAPGGIVALASFCPRVPARGPATTDVQLLVDCSGSMAGDSIDAARRALQSIVSRMGAGDRFSLSRFGTTVEHRSRGLWQLTEVTRLAAQRWIGALQADLGGTEMESALASTFALGAGASSDVLVVTDGEISAIDATVESARASGHRVFVVGIGSSPAESHLRRLAEATGGACDFVAPGEAVEPAVLRMFARLRSPRLDALRVEWPGGVQPRWTSALPRSAFGADTVNVFALFDAPPEGEVRLLGVRAQGDAAEEAIGSARVNAVAEPIDALGRIAAHARVAELGTEDVAQARRLAVAYQLVTDLTNYLLVVERAEGERATDMPELRKVAQMVPAGWGGTGSVQFDAMLAAPASAPMLLRTRGLPVAAAAGGAPGRLMKMQANSAAEAAAMAPAGTPRALGAWLRKTPASAWPTSYAALAAQGIPQEVVDWLELVMAALDGRQRTEATVVASFLHLLANVLVFEQSGQPEGVLRGTANAVRRLREAFGRGPASVPPDVDMRFVEQLAAQLAGMTPQRWPDPVYALHAEAQA
ncbi:VIT domain-containing protein [Variovorax sp. Varisp41]|uniref:VIT domain-containing protein n=1 Tax=Variovorax sp. Varisp41 TaxID=3243033 RepID=UPI0039B4D4F6